MSFRLNSNTTILQYFDVSPLKAYLSKYEKKILPIEYDLTNGSVVDLIEEEEKNSRIGDKLES